MRTPFLLTLALAGVVLCPVLRAAETGQSSHGLTPEMRDKFLADTEQSLHGRATVSPDFWDWLDKHPKIRAGLLSAEDPLPPEFAENLDHLRQALGPVITERYANLLLGAAIGERPRRQQKGSGDGAYNATAFGSGAQAEVDARVAKVAEYMQQKKMSLVDFLPQQDAIISQLGLTPLKKNEEGGFLNSLAHATHTFPPSEALPLADELRQTISHFETKLPPFTDKGPQWPLFPLDTAPWPLMAPMSQTISQREQDYLWDRFNGKLPDVAGKRLVTYSRYTFDYEKPEIHYKQSDWNPSSIPRIIEDGGVCGRQSTLAQLSQVGLGRPAVGMYQPGHRALLSYRFDAATGLYSADREQGITTPDKSTCQWYLPPPEGMRVREEGRVVGVEYHVALALAMNGGLDRYVDSRIAFLLAQRLPASEPLLRKDLLNSATDLNPYNLDAWYALAKLAGADTAAVNQLLARLDKLMASPDSGLGEEVELAADTDLSRHTTKAESTDLHREANLVASQVGDSIVEAAYGEAFTDKPALARNRANLLAELGRRVQLNLPHGAAAQGILFRYNITLDGPAKTEQAVAAEIRDFTSSNNKPGKHKQQVGALQEQVGSLLEALPKAAERVTWLNGLCTSYPATARFQMGKEGKAVAEPLYGYLQEELIKSLKAVGPQGVVESKRLASEFEAARANFESKTGKT